MTKASSSRQKRTLMPVVAAAVYRRSVTVVERLAGLIDGLRGDRVFVAFDGPDAAGKTILARRIADLLDRPAICASIDG